MPALKNPRHEKFAQGVAKGLTAEAAYVQAGYASNGRNASRLKSDEAIQARIAELVEVGARRAKVDVERVIHELAKIAFANMGDYIDIVGKGAVVNLSELTPDQAAAITELTTKVYKKGVGEDARSVTQTKIKLAGKRQALYDLGRHLAMFTDRRKTDGLEDTLAKMTDGQLARFQAELERGLDEAGAGKHDERNAMRH